LGQFRGEQLGIIQVNLELCFVSEPTIYLEKSREKVRRAFYASKNMIDIKNFVSKMHQIHSRIRLMPKYHNILQFHCFLLSVFLVLIEWNQTKLDETLQINVGRNPTSFCIIIFSSHCR